MASMLVTAESLITSALTTIGVYELGTTINASDAQEALRRLNAMMSSWATQPLTMPVEKRETFTVTANTGTYTIGPGATFNTVRPVDVARAGLLYNTITPKVEIEVGLLTPQSYADIQVKDQTSTQWSAVYYLPTFATSGYGTIILWPIPTTADNLLVLYTLQALSEFTNLTTEYYVPPGYEEALAYNLALRLAAPFGKAVDDDIRRLAVASRAQIKRTNTKMELLENDMAGISSLGRPWNAQTNN
jgi:hypothetical protein